jgi:hypothetical protein
VSTSTVARTNYSVRDNIHQPRRNLILKSSTRTRRPHQTLISVKGCNSICGKWVFLVFIVCVAYVWGFAGGHKFTSNLKFLHTEHPQPPRPLAYFYQCTKRETGRRFAGSLILSAQANASNHVHNLTRSKWATPILLHLSPPAVEAISKLSRAFQPVSGQLGQ